MHTFDGLTSLLQQVYDSAAHFAIFTTNLYGKLNSWNLGAAKILGFSRDNMIGNDLSQIFTPEDRTAGAVEDEMATAAATGRATDYRWHVRKNGGRFLGRWDDDADSRQQPQNHRILQNIAGNF